MTDSTLLPFYFSTASRSRWIR